MHRKILVLGLAALVGAGAGASTAAETARKGAELKIAPDVDKRLAKFSPTPLEADLSSLSAKERQVLDKLVEAAKLMNEIFLRQAWAGNVELRTWITLLGAVGDARADVYCYEPSWHHGNAVVEWPV